jgi:cysteine-S-conjugate beta-lyase
MVHNFDLNVERRTTDSIKWRLYKDDEVLPLWVADMDFQCPEPIVRALRERVDHGIFGYAFDSPQLRDVIVERSKRRYNWDIKTDEIKFFPNLVSALALVGRTIGNVGTGIALNTPIYPPFIMAAEYGGRVLQASDLKQIKSGSHQRYEIDFDALEASITPRTKLFMLCNPHNPVGRVYERWELERIAEICLKHDLIICSDEIHCDLLYEGRQHIPIASLSPEVAARCITMHSPSKTFNTPGLGCAYIVIQNPQLAELIQHAATAIISFVGPMGFAATIAAYTECDPWLNDLLDYLKGNRDYIVDYVSECLPGVSVTQPEGTFLTWLDCREAGIEGNPYKFFLDKAKVALNNGTDFGRGGDGFVRLNFGCPRSTLVQALERMKDALSQ